MSDYSVDYEIPVTQAAITSTYSNLSTTRAKMIAMHRDGFTRQQIADALGKRYQHVRNELVAAGYKHGNKK